MSSLQNISSKKDQENWEIEIKAEITPEALTRYRGEALKDLTKTVQLKGFRAGHAPESEIIRHVGEAEIMRRAADMAVRNELPELLAKEKANIVDSPQVTVDVPKPNEPLGFTARAPLAPEITLPDYKKIAAETNLKRGKPEVTEKETKETLIHIRRERARIDAIESGKKPEEAAEAARAMKEEELPELDDTFVKTLGYENVAAFTAKLAEQLLNEKTMQENAKDRATLLENLVKQSKISYPSMLKNYELDDMESRLADEVARLGRTMESYYTEVKKTRDELRKEWLPSADTRVKTRLILAEIARKESIEAEPKEVEHELSHAKKHYAQAREETLRAHITHALKNEAVLKWLETQTGK